MIKNCIKARAFSGGLFGSIQITMLPCLQDNYIFILESLESRQRVVVDPAESETVRSWIDAHGSWISEIWVTHHHGDHVDGILDLSGHYQCPVRGSQDSRDRIPGITIPVGEGAHWDFQESISVHVLCLPGHTRDHLAYYVKSDSHSLLFSGDILFGLGCGRLFEGTSEQMVQSLSRVSELPPDTLIFCSHEYTEKNLEFTMAQGFSDLTLERRALKILKERALGKPTVPLLLKEELETNLFLKALRAPNSLDVFRRLREQRNHWV